MHDSIGQRLLVLQKTFSKNKSQEETELKMINDVINEVRNISHNLHPFQFRKLGLTKSLENMMDAFQKSSEVFYSYEIDDDIDVYISKEKGLFIFRMLQECIANVEKHANATACNLTIINEAKIEHSVIGIRSRIDTESVVINTYMMGSDYYQPLDDIVNKDVISMGIGSNCFIKNAILDKNCCVGDDVKINGGKHLKDIETEIYAIRDGIVVVKKGAIIPNGYKN